MPETGNCDYESAEAADAGAADASFYTDGAWWYVYPINPDNLSEGWCYRMFYREPDWGNHSQQEQQRKKTAKSELSPIDLGAENQSSINTSRVQSAHDELVDSTWNDLPANKCGP